jgi:transposase
MPVRNELTSPKEDVDLTNMVAEYLEFTRDMTYMERTTYVRRMLDEQKAKYNKRRDGYLEQSKLRIKKAMLKKRSEK